MSGNQTEVLGKTREESSPKERVSEQSKGQLCREVSEVRTEGLVASAGTLVTGRWGPLS